MPFFERPASGYTPTTFTANKTKYHDDSTAVPAVAISSVKIDGDINALGDAVNNLEERVVATEVLLDPVADVTQTTITAGDSVVFADASDSDNLKRDTVQGILNLFTAIPSGAVIPFAGSSAPSGWLLCAGQAVSRSTYSALFAVIGTTYGAGDGSTTFTLPDLKGRAVFGLDNMGGTASSRVTSAGSGVDGATLGASGGSQFTQTHSHNATVTDPGHTHDANATYGAASNNPSGAAVTRDTGTSGSRLVTKSSITGITVANDNYGSGSSQNMPPAMMLNMIIKA
ncbi:tail fiber protein [Mesorhizobium sp. M8A.F.Ca.ET.165.01.1.1]|uniref:phage tail protein n=1 Tax=Mesorhizobium sp. M8A.F.Ca.ET.165.01.1.1 TaxID=2563960 RepID=UPI0010939542|nr:tail fiber protein [Mesorhizobium sp. M8A.F.Ca.ET.165.01.1.1]TGT42780.1 tail fiber protein [Mesorhizobium sp. M8A.F.Ca.ET.165.01.1.1]